MAVKFKRNADQKFDWNIRGRSAESIRKKTLYIYAGLMIAFFASFVIHMIGKGSGNEWMSSREGIARVTEKVIQREGRLEPEYLLRCAVVVPNPKFTEGSDSEERTLVVHDLVNTDEASFKLVQEGSEINVTYRVNADATELRIHRMILNQITVPADQ